MNSTVIGNNKVTRYNYSGVSRATPLKTCIVYKAFNNIVCALAPLGYSDPNDTSVGDIYCVLSTHIYHKGAH